MSASFSIRPGSSPLRVLQKVGVGGLVLSGDASDDVLHQKVLVVRERHHKHTHKYKLPGGLANAGEDFGTAAAREVRKEADDSTARCIDGALGTNKRFEQLSRGARTWTVIAAVCFMFFF